MPKGEGQGKGGPKQGEGGPDQCVCPECGATVPHEADMPCTEVVCPECGAKMRGDIEPAEKEITLTVKGMSLGDALGGLSTVTKPYSKVSDAPPSVQELDGAKLTLSQVNWIAKIADGLKGKEGIDSPWAVAIGQFKRVFKKEGDKWVKKKKEFSVEFGDEAVILRNESGEPVGEHTYGKDGEYRTIDEAVAAAVSQMGDYELLAVPRRELDEKGEPTLKMYITVAKALLTRQDSLTTVWREEDGARYYMALVSMSIWDEEGQLVTKEGMDFSIALAKKYDYHSGLYIRHVVPASLVGRSLYERRLGPYWIEVGKFHDTPLADRAYEILEKDEEGKWKLSIGFITPKEQAEKGRYTKLLKYDSTITDRPALPVTQVLAVGGKEDMEGIAKLLEFLNSDGGGREEKDLEMLAEIFGVEQKELVARVKEEKGLAKVRAALEEMEDGDMKKKLIAAMGGDEEEPEKGKSKKKELLDPDVIAALKSLLSGKKEGEEDGPSTEPVADIGEVVRAAIAPLVERVEALEGRPQITPEDVGKEVKEVIKGFQPGDPPRASSTAPSLEGVQQAIERMEKMLGAGVGGEGKHPLAGFAGGPAEAEGG